jgi:hypothetical protein
MKISWGDWRNQGFGDYEQKQQIKYKKATKGKGMITLFRKTGFQTYLVDEFNPLRTAFQSLYVGN